MRRSNPLFIYIFSGLSLAGVIAGLYGALHSPLFMVRVVEVADQPEDAPLDARTVSTLADVPLGEVSLVDLNLEAIRKRLESHTWIRGAVLTKRFPQTLSIQVIYRSPIGLLQSSKGALQYVDEDGSLFGELDLRARSDLPLLSGSRQEDSVRLLKSWGSRKWKVANQVSQIVYDEEEGFQVWTTFKPSHRVVVILGQEIDAPDFDEHLARIDSVFGQVVSRAIPARQIYADSSKKIVVRTVRGS
jgi:hypothetical protein